MIIDYKSRANINSSFTKYQFIPKHEEEDSIKFSVEKLSKSLVLGRYQGVSYLVQVLKDVEKKAREMAEQEHQHDADQDDGDGTVSVVVST